MSDALEPEAISRRSALSFLGLAGALGLAAPQLLLTASAAEAEAIPPVFAQADKPLPGESGRARTSPEGDKPIVGEETATRRRRHRRKRAQKRREHQRKQRGTPGETPPAGGNKPGRVPFLPPPISTAPP